jgi:ABC-type Fe3+ transport system permease subunit
VTCASVTAAYPDLEGYSQTMVNKRYPFAIIGLGAGAIYFLWRADSLHSVATMVVGLLLFGTALVVSMFDHRTPSSEERKQRFYALFDIHRPKETKRKVFEALLWFALISVPLLLFLRILPKYLFR